MCCCHKGENNGACNRGCKDCLLYAKCFLLQLSVATIQIVEDTKTISTRCTPGPIRPINGDANTSNVEEETPMNIEGFKQVILDDTTTTFDSSDIDFDSCTLSEIISLLHKMSRDPHTSTLNLAFTEHITNALIKAREEKLRV